VLHSRGPRRGSEGWLPVSAPLRVGRQALVRERKRHRETTPNVIVVAMYALALLIVSGALAWRYGAALSPGGVYVARLFGAVALGYAALNWFTKAAVESGARRAIVPGFLVAALTGQLM